MKCSRLNLAERRRRNNIELEKTSNKERPRRYCQRRLVNPEHDEDPRWCEAALERFRCDMSAEEQNKIKEENKIERDEDEELFLSVMNLKFQGNTQQSKRPRTCFKYKSASNRHRMFIKQIVDDDDDTIEESRLSVNPNHYFDEYVKYILNNGEHSRPSTINSSIDRLNNKGVESKSIEVNATVDPQTRSTKENDTMRHAKQSIKYNNKTNEEYKGDTKVSYHKSGKRKSLTISRAQSPETVQVIRVDVVCNNISNTSSVISESENYNKKSDNEPNLNDLKNNKFASKYLLTNSIKSLDQNLYGGSKVTLMCKTFKLADRSRIYGKTNNKRILPKINKTWK